MSDFEKNDSIQEDLRFLETEIWPFMEDIALRLDSKDSKIQIVIESSIYKPIVIERLRRLGYEATACEFIKVGHPIAHSLTVEILGPN